MANPESERRRNKILELVIEEYVTSAAPVGSEFVARKLRASLSSATIRNVMMELEKAGLLMQPHTSAGRVPTDRGYRFYVDAVMASQPMPATQRRQLEQRIEPEELDVDLLLERAGETLASLSQQAAFVVAPTLKRSTVKQIELVPLSVHKLLCVLVANEEMIASHVVEIEDPLTRDEAVPLSRFLNTELAGLSFSDLLDSLGRRMLAERDSFHHMVKRSLAILQHALSTEPTGRLLLEGASYIVSQPEFARDPRKAHALLKGLDAEEALLHRLQQDLGDAGVRVRIGREVQVPGLEECSYLAASFAIDDEIVGGIGVLGQKRMDYPRVRSLVEAMGICVTDLLTRWESG